MPSVHRQENNIVHAIRGCAKSAAPDVLYAARIDVYPVLATLPAFVMLLLHQKYLRWLYLLTTRPRNRWLHYEVSK